MRAGFGLVGFLLMIAVVIWLWSQITLPYSKSAIDTGAKMSEQANQIGGRDATSGVPFDQSLKTELQRSGGKPSSILVTDVRIGGPADTYFGLKRGDSIVEVGQLGPVRDSVAMTSDDDASAFLMDTFQRSGSIVVVRDGQRLTLPLPKPKASSDPIQQQLDAIPGVGR